MSHTVDLVTTACPVDGCDWSFTGHPHDCTFERRAHELTHDAIPEREREREREREVRVDVSAHDLVRTVFCSVAGCDRDAEVGERCLVHAQPEASTNGHVAISDRELDDLIEPKETKLLICKIEGCHHLATGKASFSGLCDQHKGDEARRRAGNTAQKPKAAPVQAKPVAAQAKPAVLETPRKSIPEENRNRPETPGAPVTSLVELARAVEEKRGARQQLDVALAQLQADIGDAILAVDEAEQALRDALGPLPLVGARA